MHIHPLIIQGLATKDPQIFLHYRDVFDRIAEGSGHLAVKFHDSGVFDRSFRAAFIFPVITKLLNFLAIC